MYFCCELLKKIGEIRQQKGNKIGHFLYILSKYIIFPYAADRFLQKIIQSILVRT
jgi:hypothetical protein